VQHRLPDIRWLAVDQRHGDRGAAGSPWEFAGDRQPSDAAAHDDDVMRTRHYAFLLWFVTRLRDAPAEWSCQYAMLGLSI
jgi:hypothetical protein